MNQEPKDDVGVLEGGSGFTSENCIGGMGF
jgi:hypothetical protein